MGWKYVQTTNQMIPKTSKYFSSRIVATKIYLEDLEKIISILNSAQVALEISDNDNIYSSVEDLKNHQGSNPKIIKIEGKLPEKTLEWITVLITDASSSVNVFNSESLLKPAYEIEKIFVTRKRKKIYSWLNSQSAIRNFILNVIFAFSFFAYHKLYLGKQYNLSFWFYVLLFWGLVFIVSELNPNSNTKIELERKHSIGFFAKNKEKVFLVIVTSVVLFLLSLIYGVLTNGK